MCACLYPHQSNPTSTTHTPSREVCHPIVGRVFPLVCACVFIKLHITAQSGPVIYSFYATRVDPPWGEVCVCVFIKLQIIAQPGPVVYSFYATAYNPPRGYFSSTYCCLEMCVYPATLPFSTTKALGQNPTPSTSTTTLCPEKNMGTKTQEGEDRLVSLQHMGKASCSPLGATNIDENPTNREHRGRLSL